MDAEAFLPSGLAARFETIDIEIYAR